MRILIATPIPPARNAPGAIGRVLNAQLVGLAERHEITIAAVAGPEEFDLRAVDRLVASGVDIHVARRLEPGGAERWRRRGRLAGRWLRGGEPWRTVWFWEPRLQLILDELLASRRFDLVAVEDNAIGGAYRFDAASATVLTEHEVRRPRPFRWSAGSSREPARSLLAERDWRRWQGYQRATWRRFALIQVFTQRDAEAIEAIAPELADRVRVNPFGVELPAALDPAPDSSRELVFVGNFSHAPNVDGALWLGGEIMPILRKHEPGVSLSIVGPWPPREVRSLAAADVRVTGLVEDTTPYLARAAVVVAPLRIGGGMRMKVLEAMALGKAVVTTPRAVEGFPAAASAYVSLADDSEGLAAAVARLLAHPEERNALGTRARAVAAEHFSAQAYARRLEAVYAEAGELGRSATHGARRP